MVTFTFQRLLDSGPTSYLTGISDLDIRVGSDGPVLYATSGPSGGITSYALTGGTPTLLDRDAFQPGQIQAVPGQTEEITINGQAVLVTLGRRETAPQCFNLTDDGRLSGTGNLTARDGFPAGIVSLETVTIGARDFVYVSHFGMAGITVYEPDGAGQLVRIGQIGSGTGTQGADLVAQTSVEVGGQVYLLALSAMDDRLTSYRLGNDGLPVQTGMSGAVTGLGIDAPSGMVPVTLDGAQYLVVAAAGSSSLSVLRLDPGGALVPVDHVIDDLNTRFQGVTALETVTVDGRVYLVAGGADDGLSLFTMLPGGRLLHLAQIADGTDMSLSNISALALSVQNGIIHVFASGSELGITHLSIDPGAIGQTLHAGAAGGVLAGGAAGDVLQGGIGNDRLRGEAGDDILIDGAGSDTLRGGNGADVFVFVADGVRDTVEDFELGIDRLDLSGLGRIYSLSQLSIVSTSWGARILFGDEEIWLYSKNGLPIDPASLSIGDLVDLAHYPVLAPVGDLEILGGSGNDSLSGAAGNDTLFGALGNDTLSGESGNDTLLGQGGNDSLLGGIGNDVLNGDAGNDTLRGGNNNDVLRGGHQEDRLYGDAGNDTLLGEAGFDYLDGGAGNDRLEGGDQADNLLGGTGNDTLLGGNGFDRLFGGDDDDLGYGGAGTDGLFGERGNDSLYGQGDNDRIFGGTGNDLIDGGSENDVLFGGAGFDTLIGSTGNDTMSGNFNADTFIFADFGGGFGQDVITDFDANNNFEKIDLRLVSSIVNFTDLAANHMTQVGGNVVIDALGGNTITLLGVNLGDLDVNDFIF